MSLAPVNGLDVATEETPLIQDEHSSAGDDGSQANNANGASSSKSKEQQISVWRGGAVIASLAVILFFEATNFSALTTTQSAIAADLDAYDDVTWFTSAYLIAMASFSPLFGRLSKLFSPRHLLVISIFIYCIGTLMTACATTLAWFLTGRALAGVGGAGGLTLTFILIVDYAGGKRRGLFIGLTNTSATAGFSLGAVLGGAIMEGWGWRAAFALQIPLALLSIVGMYWGIPASLVKAESADETLGKKLRSIDYIGATLLTTSITLLLTGLTSPKILPAPIIASAPLLGLFVLTELSPRTAPHPILPPTALRSRALLLGSFAQFGLTTARWTLMFYSPVHALSVLRWAPARAGAILVPTNVGFAVSGLAVGLLHVRRAGSFYTPALISYAAFPCAALMLAAATGWVERPASQPAAAAKGGEGSVVEAGNGAAALEIAGLLLNGAVTGAAFTYALPHLVHRVRRADRAVTASVFSTFRGFGASFGAAIGGGIFARLLKRALEDGLARLDGDDAALLDGLGGARELVRELLGSPALVVRLPGPVQDVAVESYASAVRGVMLCSAGLGAFATLLQAGVGREAAEEEGDEAAETENENGNNGNDNENV